MALLESPPSSGERFLSWYRNRLYRPILAFFRMPGSTRFGMLIMVFNIVMTFSVMDLYLNYVDPETGKQLDLVATIYAVFALLVFESALPFPDSWVTRLAFFAVPISGLLLLGQGLIPLGNTLLNRDLWNRAMASTYDDHTIVCGLGKISLKVVEWILELGEEVVVIEIDHHNPHIEAIRRQGVPVVIGDAQRADTLLDAGLMNAESIVPCTNNDLANLNIALEARRLRDDLKIVLRMVDTHMAANLRSGFDIHTVFSIPEITAPAFAAAATRAPLDHAFAFGEGDERGLLTITDFTLVAESVLVDYTIGRLEETFNVAVIAKHSQGEFRLHPRDDAILSIGDRFVVSASIDALNRLARLTPPTREMDTFRRGLWPLDSVV